MFCCLKRKITPTENLSLETIVYHGTLNKFKPNDILPPSWFSLEEEQSVK